VTPFIFNTAKSIQFGPGSLSRLGDLVRKDIGTRVMLITDPGMMRTGIIGLGGGSSLDVAKLVAVLALGREELKAIWHR